jgi:hypothetical protein
VAIRSKKETGGPSKVAIRYKKEIGSLGKVAKVSKKVIGITSLELRNFGMK